MATTASFKQQCPSCEAWVPVRDPNLIGRKIDCPKCKYRFVVEDPGDGAEGAEEGEAASPANKTGRGERGGNGKDAAVKGRAGQRQRGEDEGAATKAGGGNTKLILGIGLGVAALVILVAVGYMIWPSSTKKPTSPSSPGSGSSASTTTEDEKEDKPAAGPNSFEMVSNLLPPGTEGVCNIRMQQLRNTSLGRAIFDTPGALRVEGIDQQLGLAVEDIDVLIQAWSLNKHWLFNVLHTSKPFNLDSVKSALRAKPVREKIQDQEYFVLDANPWLDTLISLSLPGYLRKNDPSQSTASSGPVYLRKYDDQTLVLADEAPMKEFLTNKGRFPAKEKPQEPAKDAGKDGAGAGNGPGAKQQGQGGPMPGAPGAGGGPPGGMRGGMPGGPGGKPGMGGMMPGAQGGGANEPAAAPSGAYLTIDYSLKSMLDKVENKQTVISGALDSTAINKLVPLEEIPSEIKTQMKLESLFEEKGFTIGASVGLRDGILLTLGAEAPSEDQAKQARDLLQQIGPLVAAGLSQELKTEVKMADDGARGGGFGPGGMMGPGGMQGPFPGGGMRGGMQPPGAGGMPMGPPGAGGMRGGMPMGPPGSGGMPMQPGMPGMGGMQRPGGTPLEPPKPEKPASTIKVTVQEKTLLVAFDLVDAAVVNRFMRDVAGPEAIELKGRLDMAGKRMRVHELAKAASRYPEVAPHQGQLPRGTAKRESPASRAERPYPPNERVSWMADLLPFMQSEHQALSGEIHPEKSWRDPENLNAARVLIPQFLDPQNLEMTWRVQYPGTPGQLGATHFVGIAGIGLDAAEYDPDKDPSISNKLGIFSYDRVTQLKDISDGTSNTIMMAEVPPVYKRPWLAGGGATIQGVPEHDSIKPFVSMTYNGKKGTLVVMADSSVRFVSADVGDEVFKALCTIKGGETVVLNRMAPLVGEDQVEQRKVEPLPFVPPPAEPSKSERRAAAERAPAEWKEFTSREGRYSVLMPGTPIETTLQGNTPAGQVTNHLAMAFIGGGTLVVNYADLPTLPDKLDDTFWAGIRSDIEAGSKGKVTSEKEISLGSYPGREYEVELAQGGTAKFKAYQVKQRHYRLTAPVDKVSAEDAQKFFDSFKLLSN